MRPEIAIHEFSHHFGYVEMFGDYLFVIVGDARRLPIHNSEVFAASVSSFIAEERYRPA
jgi:hypothetical protein